MDQMDSEPQAVAARAQRGRSRRNSTMSRRARPVSRQVERTAAATRPRRKGKQTSSRPFPASDQAMVQTTLSITGSRHKIGKATARFPSPGKKRLSISGKLRIQVPLESLQLIAKDISSASNSPHIMAVDDDSAGATPRSLWTAAPVLRPCPYVSGTITGSDTMGAMETDSSCTSGPPALPALPPFLQLPPEIRNRIYELALCSPRPINITGPSPQQPGLTRVNQQLRVETLALFYQKNEFVCTISNYDPSVFKRYRKIADPYGLSTVLLTHRHDPAASRELLRRNLLSWLRGTLMGETSPLGYSAGHTEDTYRWEKLSHRIVKVFNVVRELRKSGMGWDAARPIMENVVDAAGVCGENRR